MEVNHQDQTAKVGMDFYSHFVVQEVVVEHPTFRGLVDGEEMAGTDAEEVEQVVVQIHYQVQVQVVMD